MGDFKSLVITILPLICLTDLEMPSEVDTTKHVATPEDLAPEDSEHVRLVISDESTSESDILQLQTENRDTRFKWWIKTLTFSIIAILLSILFLKWGVPFLFEKVHNITFQIILLSA